MELIERIYATEMIILLEGIKTKCSKTYTKVLLLSMKKQTSSKICHLTF